MGGACSMRGRDEKCRKPEGKRPLGTSRRRLEDNIRMDVNGDTVMNLRIP